MYFFQKPDFNYWLECVISFIRKRTDSTINYLPDDEFLTLSKSKAFADDIFNVAQIV